MRIIRFLPVILIGINGCASMEAETGESIDRRSDSELQMARNPVSCLVINMIDSVVGNDLPRFRDNYRWAGFEASDDFLRFRRMLLISTLPFDMRMDPPIYQVSGRGEADLMRIRAQLACNQGTDSYADGFVMREVRGITCSSIEDRCQIELFFDGKRYMISRVVWGAGK